MKKIQRLTASLLALLSTLSIGAFAGCNKDKKPTGGSESNSSITVDANVCTDELKGHEYSETTGKCIRCDKQAIIPAVAIDEKFPLLDHCDDEMHMGRCNCTYKGTGSMNDRVELTAGCHTVEIPADGEIWLSFSVQEAGQYVFHSVSGTNGVTAARYSANPGVHLANPNGVNAIAEGDDFFSYVNCGETYHSENWRATYCLKGTSGAKVKVRLVKIAPPAWEAQIIYTKVYANQIKGVKAEEAPSGTKLAEVPYDAEYYFDEETGYYRFGNASTPGKIIYAAIDREAPRLFGTASNEGGALKFTNVLRDAAKALNIDNGTLPNGDISVLCYTPFIMNWKNENAAWSTTHPDPDFPDGPEADLTKNCYQNFCNSDGVYPVTQELKEFLTLYTSHRNGQASWLAACYYYEEYKEGTEQNPKKLTEGSHELTLLSAGLYYTIEGTGNYTITCQTAGIKIFVNDNEVNLTNVSVTAPCVFRIYNEDLFTKVTVTITITKN